MFSLMHVHPVFVTKYRRQILTMTRQKNYALTFQMYADFEAELVEMDGEPITSIC